MTSSMLLEHLIKLESAVFYTKLPPEGQRPFAYQQGQLPILISAPHATAHRRKQRTKGEEEFTAALAQYLAESTGVHALYSRYRALDDPNWDQTSPYKKKLKKVIQTHNIRFVLDLHGMSNRHKIGLALGTMNGRSCPEHEHLILQIFQQLQYCQIRESTAATFKKLHWDHFVLNHSRFTGGVINHTITRFVSQRMGIPALQLELCSTARVVQREPYGNQTTPFRGLPEAILRTIALLQALVGCVATAV